jgi:hypothetical protein
MELVMPPINASHNNISIGNDKNMDTNDNTIVKVIVVVQAEADMLSF